MKIAFFCDAYTPTKNGVAASVQTTADELRARGHRVIIFAPRFTGHQDDDPDIIRFVAGHWFKVRDYPVAYPFLSRVAPRTAMRFRREKFDVVHVHSPFVLGGLGAYWAEFHFVPLVWTFHTLYHHYAHYSITPPPATRWYIMWRVRSMLEKSDRVIAPSQAIERIIHKIRRNAPTRVVPTGINLEKFAGGNGETVRKQFNIAPDATVLLYVGRLATEKNLGFLVRAVAPLLKSENAHLLLVGGGPDAQAIAELAGKLGVESHVHFAGFIESNQIPDFYAAGDIFTFASRTETQGLCIAEAMAAGLPSVVVNAMGAPEALENTGAGFIVPPNERRFREAVGCLIQNPQLRAEMAQKAKAAAPQFSHEKRVSELLAIYEELIEEVKRRNEEADFPIV